jgi:hypothetical protein
LAVITIITITVALSWLVILEMFVRVIRVRSEFVKLVKEFVWTMGVVGENVNFSHTQGMYKNIVQTQSIMTVMDKLMKDVKIRVQLETKFPVTLPLSVYVRGDLGRVCRMNQDMENAFLKCSRDLIPRSAATGMTTTATARSMRAVRATCAIPVIRPLAAIPISLVSARREPWPVFLTGLVTPPAWPTLSPGPRRKSVATATITTVTVPLMKVVPVQSAT